MIRSFDVPVRADGTLQLPAEIMEALNLYERPSVTLLIAGGVAHILPAPMSIEEIRGSLPALDHETDIPDDDTLLDAFEITLSAQREHFGAK